MKIDLSIFMSYEAGFLGAGAISTISVNCNTLRNREKKNEIRKIYFSKDIKYCNFARNNKAQIVVKVEK